jgi:RNA polymerase subunit RPABC4/transcription elongation factor Spt4
LHKKKNNFARQARSSLYLRKTGLITADLLSDTGPTPNNIHGASKMCLSGYGWQGNWLHGVPFLFLITAGCLLILFLYLGRKEKGQRCHGCGHATQASFLRCPSCGHELKTHCPACHRIVEKKWQYCPHCRVHLHETTTRKNK